MVIRKIRSAGLPRTRIDAESERRFIYARRENLPMRSRVEPAVQVGEKKGRGSRRRTG
jgi:hypothetical protein